MSKGHLLYFAVWDPKFVRVGWNIVIKIQFPVWRNWSIHVRYDVQRPS